MAEEVTEDVTDVETQENVEQQALEDRARRQGWRPKDEYNGPADRWVPAQEFLDRGEREWPILRERVRTMSDRLASTERELIEAKGWVKEQSTVLTELRDMVRTSHKRGYEQAVAELSQRERRAVEEANTAEYDKIQAEKQRLGPPPVEKVEQRVEPKVNGTQAPIMPPEDAAVVERWIGENPWFNNDPELNAVATSIHGVMRKQNPTESLVDNLGRVKDRIAQMFPDKFDNPRRQRAAAVSSSASPITPKSKHKTVNDLPQDAKEALARFKRQMPTFTDEEYLRNYYGEEYNTPGAI